mmetsp:Transcript_113880/g.219159  ORF Transcript_113880/g.219159 Transcript_113880/m.219159 type:complete len:208 (+) Transcript_113880:1029-1652(+)
MAWQASNACCGTLAALMATWLTHDALRCAWCVGKGSCLACCAPTAACCRLVFTTWAQVTGCLPLQRCHLTRYTKSTLMSATSVGKLTNSTCRASCCPWILIEIAWGARYAVCGTLSSSVASGRAHSTLSRASNAEKPTSSTSSTLCRTWSWLKVSWLTFCALKCSMLVRGTARSTEVTRRRANRICKFTYCAIRAQSTTRRSMIFSS